MSRPVDIRELARMLNARAASLARLLLPNGREEGRLWATSSVADYKTGGYSLKVNTDTGAWADYGLMKGEAGAGGDMLELVALVKFGGDKREACSWGRSWMGLDGLDPGRLATVRAEQRERDQHREEKQAARAEWIQRTARQMFVDPRYRPLPDSPAELYLASRGIDLSLLGRVTSAIGYHPAVKNTEAGTEMPAMIARVLDAQGRQVATHRTWIEPDPATGLWRKARLAEPKKLLGSHLGGYIPVHKGAHRETLRLLRAGVPIAVSEGIEDALTVACACPDLRVLSAVALSNIANLPMPPSGPDGGPGNPLTIIAQNDPPGSDAARTLTKVIERLAARGVAVAIARPPASAKDANDLVTESVLLRTA